MRKTVCIDLDGTLADYSEGWRGVDVIGEPIAGAKQFVEAVREFADVVIFTTRCNPEVNKPESARLLRNRVRDWLEENGIPWDDIYIGVGKPIASAYVDDKAVICRPQKDDVYDYDRALAEVRALVAKTPLGGTGEYPSGKLDEEDEGELQLSVGSDNGTVRVDFGKPVAWLAMSHEEAEQLAMVILKHARKSK